MLQVRLQVCCGAHAQEQVLLTAEGGAVHVLGSVEGKLTAATQTSRSAVNKSDHLQPTPIKSAPAPYSPFGSTCSAWGTQSTPEGTPRGVRWTHSGAVLRWLSRSEEPAVRAAGSRRRLLR